MATPATPEKRKRRLRKREPSAIVPAGSRALIAPPLRRYATDLARWRAGNQITLLRAGAETFPAMLEAIAGARRSICLETYIFEGGVIGTRIAEALIERAGAGVIVRVIFDAMGSLAMPGALLARMRDGGVIVHEYHPVAPWRRRWNIFRRDHRKILVVDDEVAFTGGLNITDDNGSIEQGGKGWHDLHCKVRGPIVLDLGRLFRKTWLRVGGEEYPAPPRAESVAGTGGVAVHLVDNAERRRRAVPRRTYLAAFNAARELIYIENAYFLPDRGVARALVRAVRRGVDVRVLVPGRSDVKAIEFAGLYLYNALVKRGVRIYRWKGAMVHAKTAVVDRVWSIVGSYNFDSRSLFYNLEVAVDALDREFGGIVAEQFLIDQELSEPFDERAWQRLSWWRKALAWAAFQVRRWL